MATRLDASRCGVVVLCDQCPSFREHRPNRESGDKLRREHERAVHGEVWGSGSQALYRIERRRTR